jgi:hypothetical protein
MEAQDMPSQVDTLPVVERLKEAFTYNPETGEFLWNVRPMRDFATYNSYVTWHSRFAGKVAGWKFKANGRFYMALTLDYQKLLAHRVAWKIMTGEEPKSTIDHEDNNGLNNRWGNLREATRSQQGENKRTRIDSESQVKGVDKLPSGRYRAQIRIKGKSLHLGVFDTLEEAHEVYCTVAKDQHGEFFNPG